MAQTSLNSTGVASSGSLVLQTNGTTAAATFDTAQNMGLGVTPSAWSQGKALEVFNAGYGIWNGSDSIYSLANTYFNSGFKYARTGIHASHYYQFEGKHVWSTAPTGTAGNAITFTQAMTLDASGNLGVATTTPKEKLHVNGGIISTGNYNGVSNGGAVILNYASGAGQILALDPTVAWKNLDIGSAQTTFSISGTERARIDSSGNLLVGTTSVAGLSGKISVVYDGNPNYGVVLKETAGVSGTGFCQFLNSSGTTIGSITRVTTTNAVVYNTTSDQRLKSNIEDAAPVLEKLMSVQVRQYDWTEGDLHQDYGFVAQELEPLLSGIVTKGKTEEDIWQLDYSRLTPHLLKAIQELKAELDAAKARITTLEA